MKLVLIDNYDSFTHILLHYFECINGVKVNVMRNDNINYNDLDLADAIILSPGPGLPNEAGELMVVIKKYYLQKPMLGVCLGHQALAIHFGAELANLSKVVHGQAHNMLQKGCSKLFETLPNSFKVARYHSWLVKEDLLPACLLVTGTTINNEIMAFEHNQLPIVAVQFHPESILTEHGYTIIENFIKYYCKK